MCYKTAPLKRTTHISLHRRTLKQYFQWTRRPLHYRASLAQPGHAAQSVLHCSSLRGTFHRCDILVRSGQGGESFTPVAMHWLWRPVGFQQDAPTQPVFPCAPCSQTSSGRLVPGMVSYPHKPGVVTLCCLIQSVRDCGRRPANRTSSTLQRHWECPAQEGVHSVSHGPFLFQGDCYPEYLQ